jgi:hypothetical protein
VSDTEDDCSGCEGWDELDPRGYCPTCAHSIDHDPWIVTDAISGDVVRPGPYPRDLAEHVARVHNHAAYTSQPRWTARRAAGLAAAVLDKPVPEA